MNNDNKPEANPFGLLHLNLARALYAAGKYNQMMFTLYISTRSGIAEWEYNESDIRTMTGLHRKLVVANCAAFVAAGIFKVNGVTSNGSPRYSLEKVAFDTYMKSATPLEVKRVFAKKWGEGVALPATLAGYATGIASHTPLALPAREGVALPAIPPYRAMPPNKEDNREEKEKSHTQARGVSECVSVENSPEAVAKANEFIKAVKAMQAEAPCYGLVVSNKCTAKAVEFFNDNATLTPATVITILERVLGVLWAVKLDIKKGDLDAKPEGYDVHFYTKRSNDVAFFLNNYHNILGEIGGDITSN